MDLNQSTAIAMPTLEGRVVTFAQGKGYMSLAIEGAIFKGGKALAAVRSVAAEVALKKALTGRYQAAADLIGTSMPASFLAGFRKFAGEPSSNKMMFTVFCEKVLSEQPKSDKGWNAKQNEARDVARAFLKVLADEAAKKAAEAGEEQDTIAGVIENGATS